MGDKYTNVSSSSKDRYKFKNWTKGYTLAPPNPEGSGDFTIIDKEGKVLGKDDDANNPLAKEEPKEGGSKTEAVEEEEEEEEERTLQEIIGTRNPIMWCNDQSKIRRMRMEWEQVSENGKPHQRTYTWKLKMGDLETEGTAPSKKGAKNDCAEMMVRKLDKLGKGYKGKNAAGPVYGPAAGTGAGAGPIDFGPGPMPPWQMRPQFGGGFRPRFPPGGPGGYFASRPRFPPGGGGYGGGYGGPGDMQPPWMMGGPMGGPGMRPPWMMGGPGMGPMGMIRPGPGGMGMGPGPMGAMKRPAGGDANGAEGGGDDDAAAPDAKQPKYLHQAHNNPISKLYEYSKKMRCLEPVFETVEEDVKDERKTHKGYTIKKTEYTIQCRMKEKVFTGKAFTKKEAKLKAAEETWAAVQAGKC